MNKVIRYTDSKGCKQKIIVKPIKKSKGGNFYCEILIYYESIDYGMRPNTKYPFVVSIDFVDRFIEMLGSMGIIFTVKDK